jgi:hypothetical protein
MQTVTMIDQDYKGATVNANGEAMARLTHQFQNVKGPEQLKKVLKSWGLSEVSPRQARFWAESTPTEQTLFCDMAKVSAAYVTREWAVIPEPQRRKLWQAVGDAATWGERLKGRF